MYDQLVSMIIPFRNPLGKLFVQLALILKFVLPTTKGNANTHTILQKEENKDFQQLVRDDFMKRI